MEARLYRLGGRNRAQPPASKDTAAMKMAMKSGLTATTLGRRLPDGAVGAVRRLLRVIHRGDSTRALSKHDPLRPRGSTPVKGFLVQIDQMNDTLRVRA